MKISFDNRLRPEIFERIGDASLDNLLDSAGATVRRFEEGQAALTQGEANDHICAVLSGSLRGVKMREDGGETLVSEFFAGGLFGELLSGSGRPSPVTVVARERSEVLFLPFAGLLGQRGDNAVAAAQVIMNLMDDIAGKYFALMRRIDILSIRSLRRKTAIFLCGVSETQGDDFNSGLSRAELAAYLNCERSALCRELSRMKGDGLIDYKKDRFVLLNKKALTALAGL